MRRRGLACVVGTLLLLAPVAGWAQDDEAAGNENEFTREGPYVSVAGVYALTHDVHRLSPKDGGGGGDFSLGFRLVPEISLAVTGIYMKIEGENVWGVGSNFKLFPVEVFDQSLVGGRVQPYIIGTAGFIVSRFKGHGRNEAGGSFGIGAGTDVYITKNLAAFGQITYTGNAGDSNALRTTQFELGLLARF